MSKLDEIIQEFEELDAREKLELLLDFAENLPELPERYEAERDAGLHRVPECMTPTYLWVERNDGRLEIHAWVAPEAPTVKGFVAILVEAFNGATVDEIAAAPADVLHRLGLAPILGMNRLRGLNAVQQRIRNEVRRVAASPAGT
jgi:cysteine desulfuration protein SufE